MNTITNTKSQTGSFLSFKISNELFAINVKQVSNILEMLKITRVPESPDYMAGIINLRGKVLPVIDMRIKLGMDSIQITKDTCILVIELRENGDEMQIGALVDSVLEVLEIDSSNVIPIPKIKDEKSSNYILGTLNHNENMLMILEPEKLFSFHELEDIQDEMKELKN